MAKIKPMLARLEAKPWNSPDWIWETKYDGVRAIVDTGHGTIQSRSGKDKTSNFPEIKPKTVKPAILDGEIVAYANGKTDFNTIQHRSTSGDIDFRMSEYPVILEVFDVLEVDGIAVANYKLVDRKRILEALLIPDERVHLASYSADGEAMFTEAVNQGLEGIMGKRLDQSYRQDAREWVKVKCNKVDNFIVCGYTAGTGWRASTFGALVLGSLTETGIKWVGEVGTGFNDMMIDSLYAEMRLSLTDKCPFGVSPYPKVHEPTWVVPQIRVIIRYLEYTNDGKLRFPAFKGRV